MLDEYREHPATTGNYLTVEQQNGFFKHAASMYPKGCWNCKFWEEGESPTWKDLAIKSTAVIVNRFQYLGSCHRHSPVILQVESDELDLDSQVQGWWPRTYYWENCGDFVDAGQVQDNRPVWEVEDEKC